MAHTVMAMIARPMAVDSTGSVEATTHVVSASSAMSIDAVIDGASETRTGGGQRIPAWDREFAYGALDQMAEVVRTADYFAGAFASAIHVDTTVSGLSEMLSIPCSTSHCAKSGWSEGPWPQMPT